MKTKNIRYMFVSKVLFVFVNFQLASDPEMRLNSKLETISNLKKSNLINVRQNE